MTKKALEIQYINSWYGYNIYHDLMRTYNNRHVYAASFEEFKEIMKSRLPDYDLDFIRGGQELLI